MYSGLNQLTHLAAVANTATADSPPRPFAPVVGHLRVPGRWTRSQCTPRRRASRPEDVKPDRRCGVPPRRVRRVDGRRIHRIPIQPGQDARRTRGEVRR